MSLPLESGSQGLNELLSVLFLLFNGPLGHLTSTSPRAILNMSHLSWSGSILRRARWEMASSHRF